MVEWGRLLSGYWGEILSRRFESCPPRHPKETRSASWSAFSSSCLCIYSYPVPGNLRPRLWAWGGGVNSCVFLVDQPFPQK